ncbi:MAG TPA: tRNA pseudouridine(54/55) synthase Pus10 [Candidatus Fraserbacteria bacterium]|nr:tRNA pseudouridine(54/55) synthase Pus10 [Candidatus Fraserbacteria bacterium]
MLEKTGSLIADELLCDHCLGRSVAQLGSGLGNAERGQALRVLWSFQQGAPCPEPQSCALCGGIFASVDSWAERALARARGWQFRTYLVGTRTPPRLAQIELELRRRYGLDPEWGEPFKQEFNREVGRRLGLMLEQAGQLVQADFREPQVSFSIDLERQKLRFEVNPLFIYGRYRKLVRTIPQTHWPCRACRGRGCPRCDYSGKMYPESVEELIAGPVLAVTGGSLARLHGAGREDINARMLGTGRPFVLEIKRPRRRELDLAALEMEINASTEDKVQVSQLRTVRHGLVARLKSVQAQKRYRALVNFARPVEPEQLDQALAALVGPIEQRTPRRVSHRRADRLRRRRVLSLEGQLDAAGQAVLLIHCEGGLYVKELVSGDEGRTRPSLAELLGLTAQVLELDVLEVCADFPVERRSLAQGTDAEVAPGPPDG